MLMQCNVKILQDEVIILIKLKSICLFVLPFYRKNDLHCLHLDGFNQPLLELWAYLDIKQWYTLYW